MRLIDADAYIKYCDDHWIVLNIDALDAQPTIIPFNIDIDAVPVVRCKDCTYCSHFTDGHLECRLLYNLKPVATTYCQMEENDFCSYGVRKGEQTM